MADILTSKIQVPSLPDDTLILKDAEARNDLSTALATATGNPLNFSTRSAQKAKETVISLEPIQDLHGYDHPWPAGGGKNLYIGSPSFDGYNNIEQYQLATEKYNGHDVIYKNQAWQGVNYPIELKAGVTYTFSAMVKLSASGNVWGYTKNNTSLGAIEINANTWTRVSFTYTPSSDETDNFRIETNNNSTTIYLSEYQLEEGSTATTYAPYSNICPIDGRTETSLVGCGKNLIDMSKLISKGLDEYTGEEIDSNTVKCTPPIYIKKDTNYTFSGINTDAFRVYFYDKYGNYISRSNLIRVFTTLDNCSYIRVQAAKATWTNDIQLEENSQATEYEPFVQSNNLTIQFSEKVYGATVELEKGTVTVDRAIVDLGTLNWIYSTNYSMFYAVLSGIKNATPSYCSIYKPVTVKLAFMQDKEITTNRETLGQADYIIVKDSAYTDAATFKAAMSGQQLCYKLATPRTIQLTPNEISLLMGVNNISTDGNSISLTYRDGKVATLGDLEGLTKKIADCEDVEITDLQDGHSLVYDSTEQKWVNSHLGYDAPVIYSTEEREIGVWTDGKPLYQKTVEIESAVTISASQWATIYTNSFIGEIEQIAFSALQNSTNGGYYDCAYYRTSGNNLEYYFPSTGNFTISAGAKITLQYTKTTDEPGSGKWTTMDVPTVHYDDTERVIGTWFGETLYQKSFSSDSTVKNQQLDFDLSACDIKELVARWGSFNRISVNLKEYWYNFDYYYSNEFHGMLQYNATDKIMETFCYIGATESINKRFFTIQYTKNNS